MKNLKKNIVLIALVFGVLSYSINSYAGLNEDLIYEVSYIGHTETVTALIKKGADVNAKDKDGRTALIWATFYGRTEIVTALIEKGADVNAKDKDGRTALMSAADNGRTEIATALIEKGADLNIEFEGKTLLTIALGQRGVPKQIPLLLYQHGIKIKDYSEYNGLLLICSKSENSAGIMASLLDLKQFKDENGVTLINSSDYIELLYACSKTEKSVDTMKLLLNLDPFKDEISEEVTTFLFFNAVGYGNILMFHFLLDNVVTLHSQTINDNFYNDFYKEDLYNFVKNKKNYEELSFLITRGVDPNRLVNIINSDYYDDDDIISIQGEQNPLKIAKAIIDGKIELETKKQIREGKEKEIRKIADAFFFIISLILFLLPIGYLYLAFQKYANYVLLALLIIVSSYLLFMIVMVGVMAGEGIKGVVWILIPPAGFILSYIWTPISKQPVIFCFIINLIAAIYYFSRKHTQKGLKNIK